MPAQISVLKSLRVAVDGTWLVRILRPAVSAAFCRLNWTIRKIPVSMMVPSTTMSQPPTIANSTATLPFWRCRRRSSLLGKPTRMSQLLNWPMVWALVQDWLYDVSG